jgi:hypothetical protein
VEKMVRENYFETGMIAADKMYLTVSAFEFGLEIGG